MKYEYIYNGAGVGIGDLNNDNRADIVFAGNLVSPRIYLNEGNFKFRDITSNFTGLTNDQWFSGVSLVDINNDGLLDLYLTSAGGEDPHLRKNRLWINNGTVEGNDPTFTEKAEVYGIADEGHSVSAAFFDYDLDGDLDLYVLNNIYSTNEFLRDMVPAIYRNKITDGSSATSDKLYRNNGDESFSDITIEAGIVFEGYGLGLAIGDVNKDGYPDIYVSNDYISNDLFYINQGDGTFINQIRKYLSYQTKSSMGNDMADINNDGNLDIYTMDMLPENISKRKQTINGFGYIYYQNDDKYNYEHQYVRNMLHVHNGFIDGEMIPFSETGQLMEIYATEWSWSPLFADYDNDGDKDLIISNGYPRDLTDKDWTFYKMKAYNIFNTAQEIISYAPEVKIPNMAFENTGNNSFIKRTDKWLPDIPSFSTGASFADLDNDGDLDYVVNNLNDEAFILRNYTVERSKGKSSYLRIRLRGNESNTMALGAKLEVWNNGTCQYAEHFLTRGYASSIDPIIHFGFSGKSVIDSLKVTWPSGRRISVLSNIRANQTIEIRESDSDPLVADPITSNADRMLFSMNDSIIDYTHDQNDFIDYYYNQPIIPHKFSQIGPRMAKGDLDKDGLEDLIIGSTNKLPTMVFLRRGKGFERAEFEGLTTSKEFSESDLAIADIDGDGDNDVVAIAGGYENTDDSEYIHYLYENNNGSFIRKSLPSPAFSASVLRPFDFDHDGDLDLFIGSRVKKGSFPFANNSWLITNNNGKLSADPSFSYDLGMVTDALWTDYDKDGWEDLLIAREWNSIALLKNINGKELRLKSIPELDAMHGIWYSLVAGDFDNNGDDDYIAGNLGENHRFNVCDKYPLNLYAVDIDLDGRLDPIMTSFWKDQYGKMKEYPVNYLDELSAQSSFFKRNFTDYASFSYAGIEDILDEEILENSEKKLRVNTTAIHIMWNDKGKFKWEKLPVPVQYSPVKKILVRDFNNDGFPDAILTGNDYTYDISTGYYDALKGIVLLSKGKDRSFEVLPPSRSGLMLQGMVESLLCFDGDTSIIVAGINRAKVAVFECHK